MTRGSPGSRAAALALLVVTLVAAYGLIGWPIQSAYQEALASIDDHRRGLSRLEAAQVRNDALARQLQSDTNGRTSPLVAAETDGSAAAVLQAHLQTLLEAHDAQLTSVEALQSEPLGTYRAINVRAQFTTGHDGLRQILFALESGQPVVFLDNVTINTRSVRALGVDRPLDIQVDLTAFRALSD
jgi:general secretion pathway protein M